MKKLLIALSLIGYFVIAGSMDYQDQVAQEDKYCEMVKEGVWPAFKENIKCN